VIPLQIVVLALVGIGGLAVVAVRESLRQVLVLGIYGVLLAALFMVFQAPDVALSEVAVGGAALPALLLIALAKVRAAERQSDEDDPG
jgi:energy-converting hydrogenase B subunit D